MKNHHKFLKRNIIYSIVGGFVLFFGVCLIIFGALLCGFSIWADGKSIDETLLPEGKNLPVFFDVNGNKIDYSTDSYISPGEIPENLKKAFVYLEDKRFYSHDGIDTYRILGATIKNVTSGKIVEGASTITQQLVKNTHLTAEKSISRKLNEMAIAIKLEENYSKDEILAMYLSVIYFGSGAYGVKDASKLYFGREISDLTLSECATLAGIVKNPRRYSPLNDIKSSTKRRNLVLSIMLDEGCITHEEYENAINEKITLSKSETSLGHSFYIERAIEELTENLGITKYQLDNSGYKIYLNMDSSLQSALEVESADVRNFEYANSENESIVIDNRTGKILAHYSSTGYPVSRQAGSTLKPLVVYAPALQDNVINLATPLIDEQTTFGDWTPKNFNDTYYGTTNAREALKKSMNTVAVKVGSYVGINTMFDYGKKFGLCLENTDKNLTLSLGATSKGCTPKTIATAYTALASNGFFKESSYVNYVTKNGVKLYSNEVKSTKVIDDDVASLLTDCLVDTVKDGTAKTLSTLPYQVASKTGTTSSDAWCVAYTSLHTVCVWHEGSEVGGGHPAMHVKRIFENTYKDHAPADFEKNNLIETSVDTYSTMKNKFVTFATDNTPQKFARKELFRKNTILPENNSLFEKTNVDFDLSVIGDKVKIIFNSESVYDYTLYRTDVFGERAVYHLPSDLSVFTSDGKQINSDIRSVYENGVLTEYSDSGVTITFYDSPITLGTPINYRLIASVKNKNSQNFVLGTAEKSVLLN